MTDHLGEQLFLLSALSDARGSLLGMHDRADARHALEAFVERVGGSVAPAHPPVADALPLDVSVGDGEPSVPVAPAGTPVRAHLERSLPELVEQASRLAATLEAATSARRAGEVDHLTGAPRRAELASALEHAVPGEDRLVGLVVGDGSWLIAPFGRMRIDGLVRTLADLVRPLRRPTDPWGRLDGPGLAVLTLRSDEARTRALLDEVLGRWPAARDLEVELRTADLPVGDDGTEVLDRLERELGLTAGERRRTRDQEASR